MLSCRSLGSSATKCPLNPPPARPHLYPPPPPPLVPFWPQVMKKALELSSSMNEKRAARGLRPRPVRAVVVGFPNVGKSALINRLLNRRVADSAPRPGGGWGRGEREGGTEGVEMRWLGSLGTCPSVLIAHGEARGITNLGCLTICLAGDGHRLPTAAAPSPCACVALQ